MGTTHDTGAIEGDYHMETKMRDSCDDPEVGQACSQCVYSVALAMLRGLAGAAGTPSPRRTGQLLFTCPTIYCGNASKIVFVPTQVSIFS